jgi:hypothetical protein
MQALSHFSYHVSDGNYILCDLQGSVDRDAVVLTDPVILSRSSEFRVTNLGPFGIENFLGWHVCSKLCRQDWLMPMSPGRYYHRVPGTTVIGQNVRETIVNRRNFPQPRLVLRVPRTLVDIPILLTIGSGWEVWKANH